MDKVEERKVFLIVSGSLGWHVVPCIEEMLQWRSIYAFCNDTVIHEKWATKIPKVKGLFTEIE